MSIYRQKVMQHFQSPHNRGKIDDPSAKYEGVNQVCGDELIFYVKLNNEQVIEEIKWEGSGCAVSQAAASMLSDMIKGKTIDEAKSLKSDELLKEVDMKLSPSRVKCALLPLYTIKEVDVEEEI